VTSEPPYRFRAAEAQKRAERAAATRELAQAQRALDRALDDAAQAQRALAELAARAPGAASPAGSGTERALELQRTAAFARRHADETRALRQRVQRAHAQVAALQAAVLAQQAALGSAHLGEQAALRDRERFERAQRKRAEHEEQVEIEDGRGNSGGREPV
jgi:hypothetical protein